MAYFYVSSVVGTNTGAASSTTKRTGAFTSMTASDVYANIVTCLAQNTLSAGDFVCVADNHVESRTANTTYTPGTSVTFISVDNANADQYLAGALINSSSGNLIMCGNTNVHVNWTGFTFRPEDDLRPAANDGNTEVSFVECVFDFETIGAAASDNFASIEDGTQTTFIDCDVTCGANNWDGFLLANGCRFIWKGGSLSATGGGGTASELISTTGSGGFTASIDSVDLAPGMSTSTNLVAVATGTVTDISRLELSNCTLPSSFGYVSNEVKSYEISLWNCDDSGRYVSSYTDSRGLYTTETTNVRTGNASVNGTDIAYEVSTKSTTVKGLTPFRFKLASIQADFSTADQIVKCHIMHDSQGGGTGNDITDTEAWIEVHAPKSGSPEKQIYSSRNSQPFDATGTDYTNNSETWVTTGVTTPVYQEISITTDDSAHNLAEGVAEVWFCLAKPSIAAGDFFVCPEVEVTAA